MRIRFAHREDKRAVAALCRRAVGPSDYVIWTLDAILAKGGVLVAWDGPRAIGMANLDDCVGGDLWLSKARTDRAYRRQGINSAVLERAAEIGRRRGHRHLRLWSNAPNVAGNATATANGFREVARFFGALRPALRKAPGSTILREASEAVREGRRSPTVRDLNGYVHWEEYFIPLTREVIDHAIATDGLRRLGGEYLLTPKVRPEIRPWFGFQILGSRVVAGLREGGRLAGTQGAPRAFTYLPDAPRYRRAARTAGYRTVGWGSNAILYERRL